MVACRVSSRLTCRRIAARLAWFMSPAAACALAAWPQGGCGPRSSGIPGISCGQDSECNSGLQCLDFKVPSEAGADAGCDSLGKECLQPCLTSADCAAGGVGLVCFASCGGTPACEPASYDGIPADAEVPTDAGKTGDP
jgi:hypothetical protein